ncbi:fimbrial protein [Enterobacter kobei]|nr:fimbrial protein [Enterobacter kobei]
MTENLMNIKCTPIAIFLLALLILMSLSAQADTSMANITVTVTVAESNCRVNDNNAVKAEFGSVQISELSKASASVPVTIACDELPTSTLSMAIKGTAASFDAQALETDVPGLGITLITPSSETLDLNTYYDVAKTFGLTGKTGSFNLTAHLTADGKTELPGGEFNAAATLVIQVS